MIGFAEVLKQSDCISRLSVKLFCYFGKALFDNDACGRMMVAIEAGHERLKGGDFHHKAFFHLKFKLRDVIKIPLFA